MEPTADSGRGATLPGGAPVPIVDAVRGGVLDAELAGLVWTLLDGGVPLVVAGPESSGASGRQARAGLAEALLGLVPQMRRRIRLQGPIEDFTWLADAERLGWRRTSPADPQPADPRATLLVAGDIRADPTADLTGDRARLAIRALGLGFGLLGSIQAVGLEEVLATLRRRPIYLTDDELSNLGVVLVLGPAGDDVLGSAATGTRVIAAHYVRPLARDVHGHTQRLPPAVLATWDEGSGRFEHFAWGVAAELAERVGRRVGDVTADSDRRAALLAAAAADTGR